MVDRNIMARHRCDLLMMLNYVNVSILMMQLRLVLVKPVRELVYQVNNQYLVLIYYLNYLQHSIFVVVVVVDGDDDDVFSFLDC